jgi:two-component system, NarL family, sensor histidine kinase EvgS
MASRILNILVADDDDGVARCLSMVIRHLGHRVDTVADGHDALLKLAQQPQRYHVLITDNRMPRLSGDQLIPEVRVLGFRGKIVVMSAPLPKETRRAYWALGVDAIVYKPFIIDELRRILDRLGSGAFAEN